MLVTQEERFVLLRVNLGAKSGLMLVNLHRAFLNESDTCHMVAVNFK